MATQSSDQLKNVTIVGGGTAGWLTALIIASLLNNSRDDEPVQVTLIESPNVPRIGVGEATVPSMPSLLARLGINETEFLRRCNASFKMSVRFDGWFIEKNGKPRIFHHPFNSPPTVGGFGTGYHFHKFRAKDRDLIAEEVIPNVRIATAGLGPRLIENGDYEKAVGYSYHVDAALFAEYMSEVCVKRGVRYVSDEVLDVRKDVNGFVKELVLEKNGDMPVDFVIDCTGFRGVIFRKVSQENFISFQNELLNDSAIAIQVPHLRNSIAPYTQSSALTAGWVWRVPLYSRVGTGYVYSSAHITDEEARREFLAHLIRVGDVPANTSELETRLIRMRIGHYRRPWIKNCVAIGLSGGFIEPLEATGIFLIDVAARWFVGHFPDKKCDPNLANRYNKLIEGLYCEIRDFILMHYFTSNRQEQYWRDAGAADRLTDSLRENLAVWKCRLPEAVDTRNNTLFTYWNFIFMLSQKDYFNEIAFPLSGSVNRAHWLDYRRALEQEVRDLIARLPKHRDLLDAIHQGKGAPSQLIGAGRALLRNYTASNLPEQWPG